MPHSSRSRLTVDINGQWRLYTSTLPADAVPLGTITCDGYDTGALVRFEATGLYAQVNTKAIRNLDGRKVAAALGLSGRPQQLIEGRRVNVYLDALSIATAAKLGNGNVSDGIRQALTHAASSPNI